MRCIVRAMLAGIVLCAAAAIALTWAVIDDAPMVAVQPALSAQTAERGLQRLSEHDPRRLRAGDRRTLELSANELQAVMQTAARTLPGLRASSVLGRDQWSIRGSMPLPAQHWLNVELALGTGSGELRIDGLHVGWLDLPAPLARGLVSVSTPWLLERSGFTGNREWLADAVRGIRLAPDRLQLDYTWSPDMLHAGMHALLPAGEAGRLAIHHAALSEAVSALQTQGDNDLLPPLQKLFSLARARGETGDASAEQASALLAIALFINGRHPADLIPEAADWPRIPPHTLTLRGREDLAQHYIGSALLALRAGAPWANAIGLSKETRDARKGSGFSFTDLLADRAGTRLGEQIAAGRGDVAEHLSAGPQVDEVLPPVTGLAEFMPEAEFRRRFGGVGGPGYMAVIRDIDARIAALPLYR